jgi:hypothetical protein
VVILLLIAIQFVRGCAEQLSSLGGSQPTPTTPAPYSGCPSRIAAKIPDSDGATVVVAYKTTDKQIVLCKTSAGQLYYHGEYTAQSNSGIAIRASTTSTGYVAQNGKYYYEINGNTVIVRYDGQEFRQTLTQISTPS